MKSGRAFTLIELLVVIAIIGILAAMLMPALSKAKNQASKVTDLNNLKQIMVTLHIYVADNNDVMPVPNWDGGYGVQPGWLYAAAFKQEQGLFWPVLRNPKIYVCPSDNVQMWHASAHAGGAVVQRDQQLSSYAMNGGVVGYTNFGLPPVKLTVMRSGDCAFWETDETEPFYFNDGANYPPEGVSPRHLQGGIQGLLDGSTSYVRLRDWYADVQSPDRNRLWCNPNTPDGRPAP